MRHNVILDLIKSNLDEMMMLAKSFEKPENCSPLLVEILQTKARELQQELDLLKTTLEINTEIEKPVQEIIYPPTVAEIKKEETETEIKEPPKKSEPEKHKEPGETDAGIKTDIKSPQPLSEEKKPAEIKPEKGKVETKEKETIAGAKKEEAPCTPKNEKTIVGERFRKEPSLNERFTEITQKGARVKGKPVTSIKAAIGLNDRFQYIRELFSNNQEKFLTTVNTLDQFSSFIEAIEYLEGHFEWPKNETSLKFMELVKRRFENENRKETTE